GDVRMMVVLLGDGADRVDQRESPSEVLQVIGLLEMMVADHGPAVELRQQRRNCGGVERWDAAAAWHAWSISQASHRRLVRPAESKRARRAGDGTLDRPARPRPSLIVGAAVPTAVDQRDAAHGDAVTVVAQRLIVRHLPVVPQTLDPGAGIVRGAAAA